MTLGRMSRRFLRYPNDATNPEIHDNVHSDSHWNACWNRF
jgi:hypothetical protein